MQPIRVPNGIWRGYSYSPPSSLPGYTDSSSSWVCRTPRVYTAWVCRTTAYCPGMPAFLLPGYARLPCCRGMPDTHRGMPDRTPPGYAGHRQRAIPALHRQGAIPAPTARYLSPSDWVWFYFLRAKASGGEASGEA